MVKYQLYPHDGEIHGEIHMNFARKVRFMVDGERIAADDTAEKLGLEETVTLGMLGASHGFHRNVGDFPKHQLTTNLGSSEAECYLVEPNGGDVIIGSVFLEIFLNQKVGFFVVYVLTMNTLFIHTTSDKILLKILQAVCFVFFSG
jgi:hypothetical protein